QRLILSACGREVLDRRSDEASGCGVAIGFGHVIRGGAEAAFEIHRDRKIGRVNDGAGVREHLVAGDPAVARAVCAGSRVAGGGDRRKAEARQNARRSRVPGVGDDERARPLMERAERIGFVELSDDHNELFLSVVPTAAFPLSFKLSPFSPGRTSTQPRYAPSEICRSRCVGSPHDRAASATPATVKTSAAICESPSGSCSAIAETTTLITGTSIVPIAATEAGRRSTAPNQVT